MKKFQLVYVIIASAIVIFACSSESEQSKCTPVPEKFSEKDLVGTWFAGSVSDPVRNDTLIIRDNGTYKQIIHIGTPLFDYESEWLSWWLEYGENGIAYLHLEEMRLCAYWPSMDCQELGGGDIYWYDFCQEQWLQTPNEGIIMVLGIPKRFTQTPRGIDLFLLRKFSESAWKYELQQP